MSTAKQQAQNFFEKLQAKSANSATLPEGFRIDITLINEGSDTYEVNYVISSESTKIIEPAIKVFGPKEKLVFSLINHSPRATCMFANFNLHSGDKDFYFGPAYYEDSCSTFLSYFISAGFECYKSTDPNKIDISYNFYA